MIYFLEINFFSKHCVKSPESIGAGVEPAGIIAVGVGSAGNIGAGVVPAGNIAIGYAHNCAPESQSVEVVGKSSFSPITSKRSVRDCKSSSPNSYMFCSSPS